MLPNVFDVHTLEKMILDFGYCKTDDNGRVKTFKHEKLERIIIATSGAYGKKQVIEVVMKKMGINSYYTFCDMYEKRYVRYVKT